MDNILLLIIKVPQNSFAAFSIQLLGQSQWSSSEETAGAVRRCCGKNCFANRENCFNSLFFPPPPSASSPVLHRLFIFVRAWQHMVAPISILLAFSLMWFLQELISGSSSFQVLLFSRAWKSSCLLCLTPAPPYRNTLRGVKSHGAASPIFIFHSSLSF